MLVLDDVISDGGDTSLLQDAIVGALIYGSHLY